MDAAPWTEPAMTTAAAIDLCTKILTARAAAYKVSASEVTFCADFLTRLAACPDAASAWACAKSYSPRANAGGFSQAVNATRDIIIGRIAYAELEATVPGGYAATTPADKHQRVRRMAYASIPDAAATLANEARRCGIAS